MRMKIGLVLVMSLLFMARCRQDTEEAEKKTDDQLVQDCKDEERDIRIRGTYTLSFIDTDFKLGGWKMTNTSQNGAEGRKEEADFTPNRFRKTKHSSKKKAHKKNHRRNHKNRQKNAKKNKKKDYKQFLNSVDNKVRLETDRAIKEAMNLMRNGDVRPVNLMQTSKIELPNICKNRLDSGENIVVAQRAKNITDCWCMATNTKDTSGISYLSLPYLNVTQFGNFFICASKSSGYKDVDGQANGKFINLDDVKEYPEALFNVVKGKHIPGVPMSWLRFWVYLCSNGEEMKDEMWKATEKSDPAKVGNETYITMFDDIMKKNVDLAIKQEAAQITARQSGVSYPDRDMRRFKKHKKKGVDDIEDAFKQIFHDYQKSVEHIKRFKKQKKHHRLKHKIRQ